MRLVDRAHELLGEALREGDLAIDDGSAIAGRIELSGSTPQVVSGADVHFDTL